MWRSGTQMATIQPEQQVGVMHEGGGGPHRQTKVFVEHSTGVFVTSADAKRLDAKQREQGKLLDALEAMHTWTTAKEDARNYEPFFAQLAFLVKRFLDLMVGLCAGLSLFLILACYAISGNSDWNKFAVFHAYHYKVSQPLFMIISLLGVVLSLFPFAHESGLTRRRTFGLKGGAGKGGATESADGAEPTAEEVQRKTSAFRGLNSFLDAKGLQPLRRLGSIQLMAFVASLGCTIATTSIEQGRTPLEIQTLSSALLSRIHIAIIVRGCFHVLAWFAAFFAPMPEFKPEDIPTETN